MITLNKYADLCRRILQENKVISEKSPSRVLMFEISKHWRVLYDATPHISGQWSEKEMAAANILVDTLAYLDRIGCQDIERLLKDAVWKLSHQ